MFGFRFGLRGEELEAQGHMVIKLVGNGVGRLHNEGR